MELRELTVSEVAARLGQPGFFVFDNNGQGRWKRGHVPGAKNLKNVQAQVSNGGGGMPAFKDNLTPKQIKDVAA